MWRVTFCGVIALFLTLWLNRDTTPLQSDTDIRAVIERTGSFLTTYQGKNSQPHNQVRSTLKGCTLTIEVYTVPNRRGQQRLLYADLLKLEDMILPTHPLQTQSFDFQTRKAQSTWTVIYKAKPQAIFLRKKIDRYGQKWTEFAITRSAVSYRGPRHKRPDLEKWLSAIKAFQKSQGTRPNK
jgi:hypothetical protein